jgi:hypothetical protein
VFRLLVQADPEGMPAGAIGAFIAAQLSGAALAVVVSSWLWSHRTEVL